MATSPAPITSLVLLFDGAEIDLGLGEHCIGRHTDCAVRVDDPLASRRHATIVVREAGVAVRDLGSRNGMLVNGSDIDDERAVVEGDRLTLGSKVIVVLRVCRALPSTPLAKIATIRRAVPVDQARAEADSAKATLKREETFGDRPAPAFRLLAEATARCVASGRDERVETILEAPLTEVLATLRAGLPVDDEILDIVVEQAVLLCEITHSPHWVDYLHDFHDIVHRAMPLAVVDRLMSIVDREP